MGKRGDWKRVSRRRRCIICDKPDWCLYTGPDEAPTAFICARVESPKRCGEAGWLHKLRDDWQKPPTLRKPEPKRQEPTRDFAAFAEECRRALDAVALSRFADKMGLSAGSLKRLGIGWSAEHSAFTFPMRAAEGSVVGIRLRLRNGRKLSVRGGHEGLFVPVGLQTRGDLYLPEGPTDTAALLGLGIEAVGRPSCNGGIKHVVRLLARSDYFGVTVVADRDEKSGAGERWAKVLAERAADYAGQLWFLKPPSSFKDMRDWARAGATRAEVEAACERLE